MVLGPREEAGAAEPATVPAWAPAVGSETGVGPRPRSDGVMPRHL